MYLAPGPIFRLTTLALVLDACSHQSPTFEQDADDDRDTARDGAQAAHADAAPSVPATPPRPSNADGGGVLADASARDAPGDSGLPAGANPIPQPLKFIKLKDGYKFTEGPVWIAAQKMLIFSDTTLKQLHRFIPPGDFALLREMPNGANGNAVGPDGSIFSSEGIHVSRAGNGMVEVVGQFAPHGANDLIVRRDGTTYATILRYRDANREPIKGGGGAVYKFSPPYPAVAVPASTGKVCNPNGIALSPDQTSLYIVDSNYDKCNDNKGGIHRFPVNPDGTLGPPEFLATVNAGTAIAVDDAGNLFVTHTNGLTVYPPDGKKAWGKVTLPASPSNLTFGGEDRRTLFITMSAGIHATMVTIPGLP